MPTWAGQPPAALPRFHVDEHTAVLDDAGRPAPPGSGLVGRLARGATSRSATTATSAARRTFPTIDGERWAIPGDLARVEADGTITLLGRGASSINTGGEKVFPDEVEAVLKAHPDVFDAVVVGVPDDRWGERVAASSSSAPAPGSTHRLVDHCREPPGRFKVPRRMVVVDEVRRRPGQARPRLGPRPGRGAHPGHRLIRSLRHPSDLTAGRSLRAPG